MQVEEDKCDGLELEMFREVKDGVEVRPLLKSEDLRLIRDAFIVYSKGFGMGKSVELWKRILRKVKE
jgi:hypothetical protein